MRKLRVAVVVLLNIGSAILSAIDCASAQELLYSWHGTNDGDLFGRSLAPMDDFDGDGIGEMVVGARSDLGNPGPGRLSVYSGATGLYLYDYLGEEIGDRFGVAIENCGDVDADGTADIIVGAWQNTSGGGPNAGKAYVYSGKTRALLHSFQGTAHDALGHSVAGAGDVDRDGHADLIVGAWGHSNPYPVGGAAYVYSGATGILTHQFFGEGEGDQLGKSVAGIGDVNKDGYPDLLAGAWLADGNGKDSGRAYVFSGRNGALLYRLSGESLYESFGVSVAGIGDIDQDQHDDFAVGGMLGGPSGEGRVCVYSGRTGKLIHTWTGENALDTFGGTVSRAGDVNLDGTQDLLIGAPAFLKWSTDPGWTYVYSGATGGLLWRYTGAAIGDRMGISIARAGDINNDGIDDVMGGAYLNDDVGPEAGSAYVFSGNDFYLSPDFTEIDRGSLLTLSMSGGVPDDPVLLFVSKINGHEKQRFLTAGYLNAEGIWTLNIKIPIPINPMEVTFVAYTPGAYAQFAESNPSVINIR